MSFRGLKHASDPKNRQKLILETVQGSEMWDFERTVPTILARLSLCEEALVDRFVIMSLIIAD